MVIPYAQTEQVAAVEQLENKKNYRTGPLLMLISSWTPLGLTLRVCL
jgi:hypothetical protein